MTGKLALVAVVLALAGCQGCPGPVPPVKPSPVTTDAAPGTCLDVCRNGAALGCPFAADTPAGVTCVTVCANNQSVGIAPWNLSCRANAKTCAAIDACP